MMLHLTVDFIVWCWHTCRANCGSCRALQQEGRYTMTKTWLHHHPHIQLRRVVL